MSHPRSYGVLIDAGFLKRQLGTQRAPVTFEQVDDFLSRLGEHPALAALSLYRIYFYDAKPFSEKRDKPLGGGEMDFGKTEVATRNSDLLAKLCTRPFVALRLGELVFRGWRLRQWALRTPQQQLTIGSGDLEVSLNQKGVDMRIGLDIAALALKRLVQVVVLVTSDTDFIPAMKFARREGLQLFLVKIERPLPVSMVEHSDLVLEIPRRANHEIVIAQ